MARLFQRIFHGGNHSGKTKRQEQELAEAEKLYKKKPCLNCGIMTFHTFCNGDCKRVWNRTYEEGTPEIKADMDKQREYLLKEYGG